jgi:hypothetical protein
MVAKSLPPFVYGTISPYPTSHKKQQKKVSGTVQLKPLTLCQNLANLPVVKRTVVKYQPVVESIKIRLEGHRYTVNGVRFMELDNKLTVNKRKAFDEIKSHTAKGNNHHRVHECFPQREEHIFRVLDAAILLFRTNSFIRDSGCN